MKERSCQEQNQKPRKKGKFDEKMIFYGFECPHCPEDEQGDTNV